MHHNIIHDELTIMIRGVCRSLPYVYKIIRNFDIYWRKFKIQTLLKKNGDYTFLKFFVEN